MGALAIVRGFVATGLLVTLAACSSGSTAASPAPTAATTPPASTTSYVALGDSFTAGPGIAPLQSNAGYCQRSTKNWPSLLAKELKVDAFTDVSCSGATSADVESTGRTAPLNERTHLVTVGAGGNDGALFTSLITQCSAEGPACSDFVSGDMRPVLEQTVTSLVSAIDVVKSRAPKAEIVLVGYLRLMPASGTCEVIGIPASQAALVASAERALDVALQTAANDAKITYVSLRDASRGHDACAGKSAWTNGARVLDADGIIFHPRSAGMRAVAQAVLPVVKP